MNNIKLYFITIFSLLFSSLNAQNNGELQIKNVFDKLVTAYGSAKTAPLLVVLTNQTKSASPAYYEATLKPTIKVDGFLYELCRTLGKDSLNALSIVLSHELAHYYNDHTFCSDFAFAVSKENKAFAKKIKPISKTQKLSLETQADYEGMFIAAKAGYFSFDIQPVLLNLIYKSYHLKDINEGYPSKAERKEIGEKAKIKAEKLYKMFNLGIRAKEANDYCIAITSFSEVNRFFPSRENYNNLGVVKTLQALAIKVITSEEANYPKRFLYPLEIDNFSRLNKETTRSTDEKELIQFVELLKSAQKDLQEAIRLDPNYTIGYINLACVFDLLDNPEAAIGKIKELPIAKQQETDAQRILAIAFYHTGMEQKAERIWGELKL
jgi:hypothetical protein